MNRLTDSRAARIARDESGIALIAAMMALMVTALLTAAAVTVATHDSNLANNDGNQRGALEAAEAGLQVGLYRVNMLQPSAANCVGDAVATPAGNGECASSSYTLGNGSSYSYYTTPVLGLTGTCVGGTVINSASISNRCITAIGTDNGVTARSQVRVASFSAVPLFPVAGITGLLGITNVNNADINGSEASNGTIVADNNVTITGSLELGPSGKYQPGNNASTPPETVLSSPIVLSPVDPGNSATSNNDYRISNYLNNPSHPTSPYDQTSGSVSFNATTRALTLGNNASITLGGGLYNFCSISATNNVSINLAPGVSTEIFIDSPSDPGSGCASGSGTLNIKNNATFTNPSDNPDALQIYVYGPDTGSNEVEFKNNGVFYGVIYAPTSTVELSNNANFNGAISADTVQLDNNFSFNWNANAGTLDATTQGLYYRTAWARCSISYSNTTPSSGCG